MPVKVLVHEVLLRYRAGMSISDAVESVRAGNSAEVMDAVERRAIAATVRIETEKQP